MSKTHRSARWAILFVASLALAGILACQAGGGEPPTVQITYPSTGGQVAVGAPVPIHSVSQDDRGVSRVELWVASQLLETTTASGTERTYVAVQHWTPSEVGVFNIGVRAYDSDEQVSEPAVIAIQVVATAAEITQPLPEEPLPPTAAPVASPAPQDTVPPGEPTSTPLTAIVAPTPQTAIITPRGADLETGNCGYPPPARVGEPVAFGLIIWNSGDDYARDFRWGIQPTSPAMEYMPSSEYIVLGPNEDRWFDWQGPPIVYDEPGQYTALVLVDVDGVVDEQNENNNQCLIEVTVEGAEAATIRADSSSSGLLHSDGGVGGGVEVGDEVNNTQVKGFITFGLSEIPQEATIEVATLYLGSLVSTEGTPFNDLGRLRVYHGDYGDLDASDWDAQSFGPVARYESEAQLNEDVDVTPSVSRAVANGWEYQLRLEFLQATNNDNGHDFLWFDKNGVRLFVQYSHTP